ncbi:MAG: ferrous iron transport protein A [Flavobacteriia bacterium]|nr:ferrous iron transport protein A [Flavobacteriia bacterium]
MNVLLSNIKPGNTVTVVDLLESSLKPKLMEMGLIAGKKLKVLFKAPFGDPIAIDLGGYVLSLRLDEAGLINVNEVKD